MSNKKGMTLIEVIIALAVFAILIVMTTGVFTSAVFISNNAKELNDNSHAAQQKVNAKDTDIPAIDNTFILDFEGNEVSGDIKENSYESNGLKYENFEKK